MTTTTTLTRKFKLGATVLDDPAPTLPPEDALRLFVPNFPYLATARLGEPTVVGDALVYPVEKPVVQTKGRAAAPGGLVPRAKARRPSRKTRDASAIERATAALLAWENKAPPHKELSPTMRAIGNLVADVIHRDPEPIRDPFLIPLA